MKALVIVLLVAAVGVAIFFAWRYFSNKMKNNNNNPVNGVPAPTPRSVTTGVMPKFGAAALAVPGLRAN